MLVNCLHMSKVFAFFLILVRNYPKSLLMWRRFTNIIYEKFNLKIVFYIMEKSSAYFNQDFGRRPLGLRMEEVKIDHQTYRFEVELYARVKKHDQHKSPSNLYLRLASFADGRYGGPKGLQTKSINSIAT